MNTPATTQSEPTDAHSDPVMVAVWNAQAEPSDGDSHFAADDAMASRTLTVTVSETVVTTFVCNEAEALALSLPFDVDALDRLDADDVAALLAGEHSPATVAVTERDLEFDITQ